MPAHLIVQLPLLFVIFIISILFSSRLNDVKDTKAITALTVTDVTEQPAITWQIVCVWDILLDTRHEVVFTNLTYPSHAVNRSMCRLMPSS